MSPLWRRVRCEFQLKDLWPRLFYIGFNPPGILQRAVGQDSQERTPVEPKATALGPRNVESSKRATGAQGQRPRLTVKAASRRQFTAAESVLPTTLRFILYRWDLDLVVKTGRPADLYIFLPTHPPRQTNGPHAKPEIRHRR